MNNAVDILEKLIDMTNGDRGSVLLVHGNLKPSALVIMQGEIFPLTQEPVHVAPQSVSDFKTVLSELGLNHVTTVEVMENASGKSYEHGQEVMRIFVARDQSTAEQLKVLFDDIQSHHTEAGLLLGYPESSVRAFLTDEMLDWDKLPASTAEVSETNMRLLGHRLSKHNWRDEVKYLEQSGNYIRSISPTIYDEITKAEA